MRKKSTAPMAAVLVLASILMPVTGPAAAKDVNRVVMATGAITSGYYLLGGGICAQVNAAGSGALHCAIETSKGTVANLQALKAGQVDLALAQSDWQHHAYAGSVSPFTGENASKDMRALMSLTGSPLVVLGRADAGINQLEDLAGKRVDIGKTGTSRRAAMDDVLAALGWDLGKFKLASELTEAEAIKSVCAGKLDALALAGISPDKDVKLALASCAMKIIPVKGAVVDKLLTDKPYYSAVPIAKGSYPGVTADVPSIGLRVILLASASVTEKDAYAIVKTVAGNLDAVRKLHASFASINRSGLAKAGISVPLHEGAAKYYRETK
ncbi:MAG: TAXI family TRAP transporter solute-binding subunit [Alphaproteobacteria bacterium]